MGDFVQARAWDDGAAVRGALDARLAIPRQVYNAKRPHEALGYDAPARRFNEVAPASGCADAAHPWPRP